MISHKAHFHFSINIPMGMTGFVCLQLGPVVFQLWDRFFVPKADWSPLALCAVAGPFTVTVNRKWRF